MRDLTLHEQIAEIRDEFVLESATLPDAHPVLRIAKLELIDALLDAYQLVKLELIEPGHDKQAL